MKTREQVIAYFNSLEGSPSTIRQSGGYDFVCVPSGIPDTSPAVVCIQDSNGNYMFLQHQHETSPSTMKSITGEVTVCYVSGPWEALVP